MDKKTRKVRVSKGRRIERSKKRSTVDGFLSKELNKLALIGLLVSVVYFTLLPMLRQLDLIAISTIAFCLALVVVVGLYYVKRRFLRRRLKEYELARIDQMTGREFEECCADIYRGLGLVVELTQQSRDQGADLILEGGGVRTVVQTKRQAGPVGNWAVQEVHAARQFYSATHAIVITNSTYTPQAKELAKATSVELLDRSDLVLLRLKSLNQSQKHVV